MAHNSCSKNYYFNSFKEAFINLNEFYHLFASDNTITNQKNQIIL